MKQFQFENLYKRLFFPPEVVPSPGDAACSKSSLSSSLHSLICSFDNSFHYIKKKKKSKANEFSAWDCWDGTVHAKVVCVRNWIQQSVQNLYYWQNWSRLTEITLSFSHLSASLVHWEVTFRSAQKRNTPGCRELQMSLPTHPGEADYYGKWPFETRKLWHKWILRLGSEVSGFGIPPPLKPADRYKGRGEYRAAREAAFIHRREINNLNLDTQPDSGLCEPFHPLPAVPAYYQWKRSSLEAMMVKYQGNPPSVHGKKTNCHRCCIWNIRVIAGLQGSDIIYVFSFSCWWTLLKQCNLHVWHSPILVPSVLGSPTLCIPVLVCACESVRRTPCSSMWNSHFLRPLTPSLMSL